eukprot:CAMPEP_0113511798 /NCGR_PEP_ID=MMETSP0014_2-20120614/38958_1 /TAXON_ID=2857 /ORGANISM="Nitzschia sp." /LENGTH=650 /DNA_ID=CAMNT_0000408033 /DNA_START=463 /DNA_END=2415 /DNA_ORIENTATION=- /assembly_acc=CAM_ASM_000159
MASNNNSRRIHGRDFTAAASNDNKKKRGNPWGNDYGIDSEYDNDDDDHWDDDDEDDDDAAYDFDSDDDGDAAGTGIRSSKRLKTAEANHKSSSTETGRKRFQPSRKAQALQPVNPNRGQRRLPSSSSSGAANNNATNATRSKARSIVVAKPSQQLNHHQNKNKETTRVVSASVAAKSGGHPAKSQQLTAATTSKASGRGTASDPLCLFSDGDEDENHRHDEENRDEDDDDDVVIVHQSRGRQNANITKRRKSRSYLSSPVPQRGSSCTSRTRTAGRGAGGASTTVVDRKLMAVQSFRPPQRYSDVPTGVTNIDKVTVNDPLHVVDYVDDMYKYHRTREVEEATDGGITYLVFKKEYRSMQPHINEKMRAILVDWLIEVHYKFKLFESTLYLTINIVDRFLEKSHKTQRRDLQLVGVTSLLIASKYEELYIPELRDLTYICDDAYTADQILDMEEKLLQTIEYKLSVPTARTFLERFTMAATMPSLTSNGTDQDDASVDEEERATQSKLTNLSSRVLDSTLTSFKLMQSLNEGGYLPSQLAAASILIARNSLLTTSALDCEEGCCSRKGGECKCDWTPTLKHYTKYSRKDLIPAARAILDAIEKQKSRQPDLIAVQKKYRHAKYGNVANYSLLEKTLFWDETYGRDDWYDY